jgi:hypothetical protein
VGLNGRKRLVAGTVRGGEFNGRVQGQGADGDGCSEDNERVISLVLSCIHFYVQDDLDSSRTRQQQYHAHDHDTTTKNEEEL